jgi:hypothetical protein
VMPGSTSDILSFESSTIYHELEGGLLAPGLCLFGDNAYINSPFMATPFSNVSGGSKDAYNFHHSQLRINIECAFGRFVHRWSILRAPMPMNITVPKTMAIIIAMAKLHNYCIHKSDVADDAVPWYHMEMNGVPLLASDDANVDEALPRGLLDSGQHFGDTPENARRQRERMAIESVLPRTLLHQQIVDKQLTRPIPARSHH